MLFRIGTLFDAERYRDRIPQKIVQEIIEDIYRLNRVYGENFDYTNIGGYSIVTEDVTDLESVRLIINYVTHPCECAKRIDAGYISAFYLLNNDLGIMLYVPEKIAPHSILRELDY